MSIRTLLVDDEPLALRGLEIRLSAIDDVEIVGTAANGREAIRAIRELRPDLVLLDIQMPGLDGFAVVRALLGTEELPLFIFVTAFDRYAIEAFEAHALDYLLKPVEEARLQHTVHLARERLAAKRALEQNARLKALLAGLDPPSRDALAAALEDEVASDTSPYERQLRIRDRGRIVIVDVRDIDYIDAAGDYMCVHVGDETHVLRETMKALEQRLDPARFQRIHRSAIVNLERVAEVRPHANGECFLTLRSGQELKVSRSYKSVVMRLA
ncbi:MAG: DNA-binding response regulator [Alphaproteobacteria bacterium]|nr:MAG: DNA-binding response regulator [Alphaproteobacteria bacterium]